MAGLTLVGAVLRFWGLGGLGLTHFDEGIYALAGLWPLVRGGLWSLDPMVVPYAPGGYPVLVGLAYAVLGVSDTAALVVSIACGVLTIPAAAWVARRTFGPGAGGAAAALAALSLMHAAFSRKALTDAPFLLCWVLAMGLGGRFLERPGVLRALALGLGVGLAQNVKYNGWLAGSVVIAAACLGVAFRADERRAGRLAATFGFGLVGALTAALIYAPWFQFVERHGGYAALLRHHQSYVGGVRAWFPFWSQQLAQVGALSGGPGWGALSWALAALAAGTNCGSPISARGWKPSAAVVLGGALGLALLPGLPWWLGLAWLPGLVRDERPAVRMLGAWWLLLSVLTPLYHPYARLWLPLHAAGWLVGAGLLSAAFRRIGVGEPGGAGTPSAGAGGRWCGRRGLAVALVVVVAAAVQQFVRPPRPFALTRIFQATSALRNVVADLPATLPPTEAQAGPLRVLARRPVAFYLLIQGRYPFELEASYRVLRSDPRPGGWAIVDATLVEPGDQARGDRLSGSPRPPDRVYREELDPVTLLDVDPDAAYGAARGRSSSIWILAPRPPDSVRGPSATAELTRPSG